MTRTRVLVTGATGLVGSYLARALAADARYEVRATRRATSSTVLLAEAAPRLDWVTGDLRDLDVQDEALADVEAVVHAAGLVSYRPADAAALREVNVAITRDLVNGALERGVGHFLHVSSIAAISPTDAAAPVDESDRGFARDARTTRYAVSKYAAELEVWRGSEEGLPVTILNPSVVLGAGRWTESSCRLFGWVDAGQRFYPPGSTGYVDARDVAAFAKTRLDAGPAGERYLLNGANVTYRAFFDLLADALGVVPPRTQVNAWQAELAWRAEAVRAGVLRQRPLLTEESARRSLTRRAYDAGKSIAAGAHYRPLEATVADVARVYRATVGRGWGVLP